MASERVRSGTGAVATVVGLLVVQRWLWPAPGGVLLRGVVIGSLTAMIAIGLSLIYRSNRIVNFAQADLGAAPTVFVVVLMSAVGLPYLVAVPLGLVVAVVLGIVVEVIIIRRFSRAPRLILTVATIGLAQLLTALSLAIPGLLHNAWPGTFENAQVEPTFAPPFHFVREIGPVTFTGNDVIAVVAVIVCVLAVAAFLRFTSIGIAVRASAESADRAQLLGIPVRRVQTVVWAVATVLAFVSMFLRAGVVGLPLGSVLGPAVLVRALAACVIGGMERLTLIFAASLALGVVEQAIIWDTGGSTMVAPLLFIVVLATLLVQRRGIRARSDEQSNWQAVTDVRPVPEELRRLPEVRGASWMLATLVAGGALVAPVFLADSRVNLLGVIVIYAMVAISLVVLTGWAGQISLGQIAFLGVGAAVGGWTTSTLGWDISIALIVAGLAGAFVAVVIGLPALRIRGMYLAVTTLAFAQATSLYFLNVGEFSWLPDGRLAREPLFGLIPIESERQYYYFILGCLVVVVIAMRRLRSSRVGRVLIGVRENERAAQAFGVNATRAKLTAFAVSGFIAAFAGCVFVHHQQTLGTQPYVTEESLAVFVMVVIGGLGSIPGALLGAAYIEGARYFLSTELAFFTGGIGLLLVLMALPGGLGGGLYQLRDGYLRWVAARRGIIVPSLTADARGPEALTSSGHARGMALLRRMADQMDANEQDERDRVDAEQRVVRRHLDRFRPSKVVGGAATLPLIVLAGLNMCDELDREATTVLLPEIRYHFGLSIQGVLTITSLVGLAVLLLELPLADFADRRNRTRIAAAGATASGLFTVFTGLAPSIWLFGAARGGASIGRAVGATTHGPLLSDFYPVDRRAGVFGLYGAADPVGKFFAPLVAGFVADWLGWRVPFLLLAVPTFVFVILATRLKEPIRGYHERMLVTGDTSTAMTEEAPASMPEAFRILWQVRSLRRIWIAIPIISIPAFALGPLLSLFYEEELGLSASERGVLSAVAQPFTLLGLIIGIPIAAKLLRRDPAMLVRFLCITGVLQVLSLLLLVGTKSMPIVVVMACVLAVANASTAPALGIGMSLMVPPRVRSVGFALSGLFVIPSLLVGPIIGGLADGWGLQKAILILCPVILIGTYITSTAGAFIASDISKVQSASAAMAEVRSARDRGEVKLLLVRDLDVHYDTVQVLFNINLEIGEGELVALLGTNGAGKSTLLRAISGILDPSAGAIVFDGADMTFTPADEVANRGVVQVPGGRGVFAALTVAENLRLAGWTHRDEPEYLAEATEQVLDHFPILRERWEQVAGNLSGGEQQMLTLAMAFITKPRLLMIDELSLGLAPSIVEQLLVIVRAIHAAGTTIILVEQSVNVALDVAETAYFLEKGEVTFHGATRDLLERPDILRAVFLGDADVAPLAHARPRHDEVVLQATDLTKTYGGLRAVSEVTFDVRRGEILGIIGPNGAGKTTLFDLLSGYLAPDAGKLVLDGHDITALGPDGRAWRGLGRSFQDARLFPGLTVAETIALALERQVTVRDPFAIVAGLPGTRASEKKIQARVDELIALVGLEAFRTKFVRELSTGSKRIVDICCLLAHEPVVMLFDEPSAGIAQREVEALAPLLLSVRAATGATMIVIEHDMTLITAIADEMLALDLGEVVVRGTAEEVLHHPRVVAAYLGTTAAPA